MDIATADCLGLVDAHPSLFYPKPSSKSEEAELNDASAIVLAHAPLFASSTSQLQSLKDLPLPPATASAALISLQPRLTAFREAQCRQDTEIDQLRARTARVLQRWYEVSVLDVGDCWQEWDGRIRRAEQTIRRQELRRSSKDEVI